MLDTFVETDCTVSHNGQEFSAGGAFLADCSDGYRRGVVYAQAVCLRVTDWHGNIVAPARFGRIYRGNYCRMQSVSFVIAGVTYTGRYCPDTADMVRVRSTRRV